MPLLLLPQAAPPGPPPISSAPISQVVEALASGTTQTSSAFAATIAGNSMVVFIARSGGLATGAITSVVDSAGGNWTQLATGAVSGGTFSRIECWWRQNCPSITTLTFNSSTAQTTQYNLTQWAGLAALDVASPANSANTSSTTQTTPAVTTNYPIELILAAWHFQQTTTSGLTAGWTALTNFDDSTSGSGRAAYLITSNTGPYSASLTLGAAKAAGVLTVALQGTAQAPVQSASIPITGSGGISLVGSDTVPSGLSVTGSAGVSIIGSASVPGAVEMSQASTLSVTGTGSTFATLPVTGSATVGLTGIDIDTSGVPVTGSAAVTVGGLHSALSTVGMQQAGTLGVTPGAGQTASVPITGTGTVGLTGTGVIPSSLAVTGSAAVSLAALNSVPAALTLLQVATVALTGTSSSTAVLPITGSATISTVGTGTLSSALSITGSAVIGISPAGGAPVPGTPITSANGNTQTNTSLSVAYPAAAVDTLMIVEISGDASGVGVAPTGMASAGWTKLGEAVDTNSGTASSSSYIGVFWRVLTAGTASGTAPFSWTNAGQMCAICTPYTNYDLVTPAVWLAGQEKTTSDTAYSASGTTGDTGLLASAFADRAGGTAFSGLADTVRATALVGTTGCILTGQVTAGVVPAGTAFTKTATGTNTSVGTAVAYTIRGTAIVDTASVPMTQTGGMGVIGSATGSNSIPVVQTGSMTVSGQQTLSAAVPMVQTGAVAVTPATRLRVWLSNLPLYVAHRGGDSDWVEMTRDAYTHAIANGATAINIDAVKCSTGEFVASHDLTTGRVFGTNLTIGSSSWASLSGLTTTVGGFPIEKVADLLVAFPDVVVFVENKGNSSDDAAFLDMLDTAGGPGRIVVKQYYTASTVATDAHARGYTTWGYYFATDAAQFAATQSRWDLLGLDYTDTNSADWTAIKSYGKLVLGHVTPSAAGAAQAFGEGADGIMTGKVLGVIPGNQQTATVSMLQAGTMTVGGALAHTGAVPMAQTGSIGIAGLQTDTGSLPMSQAGTVNVTASKSDVGALSLAQTGTLMLAPSVADTAAVSMSQSGTLSATGSQALIGALQITQSGTLVLAGRDQLTGSLAMAQTAAIGIVPAITTVTAAPMSQIGTVSVDGRLSQSGAIAFAQTAVLSLTGTGTTTTTIAMTQTGVVSVTGSAGSVASLLMQQTALLSVSAATTRVSSVPMTGAGALTLTGTVLTPVVATVGMAQGATVTAIGSAVGSASLPMAQTSGLVLSGNLVSGSALGITGSGSVVLAALDQLIGFLSVTGSSQLSLTGAGILAGTLVMAAVGVVEIGAVAFTPPLHTSAIPITGQAGVSLTGLAIALAALAMGQTGEVEIGAGVFTVRRHIAVAVALGGVPWGATVRPGSRWSASTTVPITGD